MAMPRPFSRASSARAAARDCSSLSSGSLSADIRRGSVPLLGTRLSRNPPPARSRHTETPAAPYCKLKPAAALPAPTKSRPPGRPRGHRRPCRPARRRPRRRSPPRTTPGGCRPAEPAASSAIRTRSATAARRSTGSGSRSGRDERRAPRLMAVFDLSGQVPAAAGQHPGQHSGDRVDYAQEVDPRHLLHVGGVERVQAVRYAQPRIGDRHVRRSQPTPSLRPPAQPRWQRTAVRLF